MPSSLTPFFNPRTVAVIGASRTPGTVGWQIVDNLLRYGFQGAVYPVNPEARAVHSLPVWRSVRDIGAEVDLAIVVVPRDLVLEVVDDCGAKGVTTLVVISSGFAEAGAEGVRRERELMARVRRYGMRLVGPNCMGLLNTDPSIAMNATFAPIMPPAGPISFLSQSGALGVTILDSAAEYGIGVRNFVSVGNKPDVSGNDLLEHWETDPGTRVILMYLETFGNPRRFTRIARRVSRRKPIIVVKSGRAVSASRAAWSHTGALARGDVAVDALLAQCGVLRANTVEELFDLAMAFGSAQPPKSNRVAIVTNAGGPGTIIADACAAEGLELAVLSDSSRESLAEVLADEVEVRNPINLLATTTAQSYQAALERVLQDPGVDAAIAAFVPPLGVRQQDVAESIVRAGESHPGTPVLAVLMGRDGLPERRAELQAAGVPAYTFPESAARALGALHRYGRWLERPVQAPATFPVDSTAVSQILEHARDEDRRRLHDDEAFAVLDAYGIPTLPHRLVESESETLRAAADLKFPVVLKILSPRPVHRTEMGGVILDIRTPEELRAARNELRSRLLRHHPDAEVAGFLVAPLQTGGRELILGMTTDPTFGPVLMFGLGGIHVEIFRDVAFRIPPVTELEAREMVESIRSFPILEGLRGEEPVHTGAVVEAIQRLSQLVQDHPEIAELDVNPFLATTAGAAALDVRIGVK
ncbi:MAG: acetate--CoA ligase family protein [Gemmatimonadota bacterium]